MTPHTLSVTLVTVVPLVTPEALPRYRITTGTKVTRVTGVTAVTSVTAVTTPESTGAYRAPAGRWIADRGAGVQGELSCLGGIPRTPSGFLSCIAKWAIPAERGGSGCQNRKTTLISGFLPEYPR